MATKIRTGDYVEVLPGAGNAGILDGEQGIVIDGSHQGMLVLLFPASVHCLWASERTYGGWLTEADAVKLVYRPRG